MRPLASPVRIGLILIGLGLWLALPFVSDAVDQLRQVVACRNPTNPHCRTDYIPVLEVILHLLSVLFAPIALKVSVVLWAPDPALRTRRWPLAAQAPLSEGWPVPHAIVGLLLAWATLHIPSLVRHPLAWPFTFYWVACLAWLGGALVTIWPPAERPPRSLP